MDKFKAIKDYSEEHQPTTISQFCQLVGVFRSDYYKWLKREETASETTTQALMATITELHAKYKGILDYRRINGSSIVS